MSSKYAEYRGITEEFNAAILWDCPALGTPLPPLSAWKIPTLTQYIGNGDKKSNRIIADCVSSASAHFISQKAADALRDIWDKHATLYPVILDDKPNEYYYMVVIHTVIDCLDREQSIGSIDEDSDKGKQGLFNYIAQWHFREGEIGHNELFVLPDSPTAIYATEQFKQRVIEAGVTGFGLIKQMFDEDEPFIS